MTEAAEHVTQREARRRKNRAEHEVLSRITELGLERRRLAALLTDAEIDLYVAALEAIGDGLAIARVSRAAGISRPTIYKMIGRQEWIAAHPGQSLRDAAGELKHG